jgi:nucleoside-diphosphate-sugar epimerase
MKVLLTGANGFVGSHVLDSLLARQIPVAVLLRPTADRRFIAGQLPKTEVRAGSLESPESLDAALDGVTHVIHCAGATKALNAQGFQTANQGGTRNLVDAINKRGRQVERLVHISSQAAAGPATATKPRREADVPSPVSDYGRSKLAAEEEVTRRCAAEWVILRPAAVYGPRDVEFLRLFKAVRSHIMPRFGGGRQQLTLVYVEDMAAAVLTALDHPDASRKVFFTGSPEVVTSDELAQRVGSEAGSWAVTLPLPNAVLWAACQWSEFVSRVTKKPNVLSAQKWAELKAPGWVCDVSRMHEELGFECRTPLKEGVARTMAWYQAEGWL